MSVVHKLSEHLNGNQVPVLCLDQQLYSIAKKIQWTSPELKIGTLEPRRGSPTWLQERAEQSPAFKFWLKVLNLEITLVTFVRAVRLENYEQFKKS